MSNLILVQSHSYASSNNGIQRVSSGKKNFMYSDLNEEGGHIIGQLHSEDNKASRHAVLMDEQPIMHCVSLPIYKRK